MALVTRCPECATLFKIVPDQLRISEGWVRCGHCNEVFDASVDLHQQPNEALVATPVVPLAAAAVSTTGQPASSAWSELAEPEPPPLHLEFPDPPQLSQLAPEPARDLDTYEAYDADPADRNTDPVDSAIDHGAAAPYAPTSVEVALEAEFDRELQALEDESAAAEWNADRPEPSESAGDSGFSTHEADDVLAEEGFAESDAVGPLPVVAAHGDEEDDAVESNSVEPSVPDMPSMGEDAVFVAPFVSTAVDADEPAGASPAAVAAALPLAAAPVLASSTPSASSPSVHDYSFLHGGHAHNTVWRQPVVRYALMGLATLLLLVLGLQWLVVQREVVAAHWPQSRAFLVSVCEPLGCSVSALRRIDSIAIDSSAFTSLRRGAYRLNVVLKNRSPYALAVPAIELALTDSQEQAVIRRVIPPHELGVHAETIEANGELVASVDLAVPDNDAATRIVGYRLLAFYP